MERERQAEPVVLNYASAHSTPRSSEIDVIVAALIGLAVTVVVVELAKPYLLSNSHEKPTPLTHANIQGFTSPLELYRLHVGTYPASLDDLYRPPSGMTQQAWGGPYLDSPSRLKDAWGRPFRYRAPGIRNPGGYDLWSVGKDGVPGTRDDVKNW